MHSKLSAKIGLIINTVAVRPRLARKLENLCHDRFGNVDVAKTERAGDVLRFAGQAWRQGITRLIVAGGDGTIHEAANGVVNTEMELAIIPAGSGNDYIRMLRIPKNVRQALDIAASGRVRTLDVAELRSTAEDGSEIHRIFVNIAEAGLGGRVVRLAQPLRKIVGRRAGYHVGLATALLTHRWHPMKVWIDGKWVGSYLATDLIVANGQYFGGGMRPVPEARCDDGLLDVALIKDMSRVSIALNAGALKAGLPHGHPRVDHWMAHEVRAESDHRVFIEADGEQLGTLPASFRVLPGALRVVCPA